MDKIRYEEDSLRKSFIFLSIIDIIILLQCPLYTFFSEKQDIFVIFFVEILKMA